MHCIKINATYIILFQTLVQKTKMIKTTTTTTEGLPVVEPNPEEHPEVDHLEQHPDEGPQVVGHPLDANLDDQHLDGRHPPGCQIHPRSRPKKKIHQ
jgi:hypothetical protein